jgi:hypothetical protein
MGAEFSLASLNPTVCGNFFISLFLFERRCQSTEMSFLLSYGRRNLAPSLGLLPFKRTSYMAHRTFSSTISQFSQELQHLHCVGPAAISRRTLYCPSNSQLSNKSEEEVIAASHRLLIDAGYIRHVASGIFTLLPLAQRTIGKISRIIDHHMQLVGGQKIQMPIMQPVSLWIQSGRWPDAIGNEMIRLKDRKGAQYCLGPTHEEVVTALVQNELSSYRQLPVLLYQIGTTLSFTIQH